MSKGAKFVWEFIGLILTLMGIIGMVQSASEFMYRRQPSLDVAFQPDFLALIKTEADKDFFRQLVHLDLNFVTEETPEGALNDLTRMIAHFPTYLNGYYFRGQLYLSMGRVEDGVADMQLVIEKSEDPRLRRQARNEITLARLAQLITPVPFLGMPVVALVIIADFMGIKVFSSLRSIKIFIVAFIIVVLSFIFLFLH
jgi:hypothetical protein